MGHSSIARCSCGFVSNELLCAGGMRNFQTVCNAVVICNDCGHIGTINVLEEGNLAPWVLGMWNSPEIPGGGLKTEDSPRCSSCGSKNIELALGPTEPTAPMRQVAEWLVGDEFIYFLPGPYRCPSCGEAKLIIRKHRLYD
jgi:hypothetical protein